MGALDKKPDVELIPIFDDNYVFLIINPNCNSCLLVDPGSAAEVISVIQSRNLKLEGILITHHHHDHIGGVTELKSKYSVPVYAPEKNRTQIPQADYFVSENAQLSLMGLSFEVMELPGHTLGHIAYWVPKQKWLFSGDVLFGLGCGRLFEGTPAQMFDSLRRLKDLPEDTQIFCTHEYTETNLRFCKTLENLSLEKYETELMQKRKQAQASVPLVLQSEKRSNPFLLAKNLEQFTLLREQRNRF